MKQVLIKIMEWVGAILAFGVIFLWLMVILATWPVR